jgi:hypothetical protein
MGLPSQNVIGNFSTGVDSEGNMFVTVTSLPGNIAVNISVSDPKTGTLAEAEALEIAVLAMSLAPYVRSADMLGSDTRQGFLRSVAARILDDLGV